MTWSDIAVFGVVAALVAGPTLAADVPSSVRQAGALHLSINSTYAPMEYHDPATNELKGLVVSVLTPLQMIVERYFARGTARVVR